MSDPRFFENSGPFSLIDINNLIKGELSCDNENTLITDISTLKFAGNSEITFFQDPAYKSDLSTTKASACLIKKEHEGLAPSNLNLIFFRKSLYGFYFNFSIFLP